MVRFFALVFLLSWGCVANDGLGSTASSETNIFHLSKLSLGMNQREVLQIMRPPYKQETFPLEEATYDVWFYVTRPTVLGQSRMVPQNLTPLTFKNGKLVGWGFAYYNYLVKKEGEEGSLKSAPVEKKEENEELEKILQTPPSSTPAPASPVKKQAPITPAPTSPVKKQTPTAPLPEEPIKKKPPEKSPPSHPSPKEITPVTPPSPKIPNPPNIPPVQTPPPITPPSQKTSSFFSMSPNVKKPSQKSKQPEKETKKKPLTDEKDQEMLDEASDQNFNQT